MPLDQNRLVSSVSTHDHSLGIGRTTVLPLPGDYGLEVRTNRSIMNLVNEPPYVRRKFVSMRMKTSRKLGLLKGFNAVSERTPGDVCLYIICCSIVTISRFLGEGSRDH